MFTETHIRSTAVWSARCWKLASSPTLWRSGMAIADSRSWPTCGRGKHRVDYRHIIDWLVRKPARLSTIDIGKICFRRAGSGSPTMHCGKNMDRSAAERNTCRSWRWQPGAASSRGRRSARAARPARSIERRNGCPISRRKMRRPH